MSWDGVVETSAHHGIGREHGCKRIEGPRLRTGGGPG